MVASGTVADGDACDKISDAMSIQSVIRTRRKWDMSWRTKVIDNSGTLLTRNVYEGDAQLVLMASDASTNQGTRLSEQNCLIISAQRFEMLKEAC